MLEKKIICDGLCARCYDIQRLGGVENYRMALRAFARKYRSFDAGFHGNEWLAEEMDEQLLNLLEVTYES